MEVMERMWNHNPDERISIFDVVIFLREVLAKNRKGEGNKEIRL